MALHTYLRNNKGQILLEAVIVASCMIIFLLFIDKLILYKKMKSSSYQFIKTTKENEHVKKQYAVE